MEFITDKVKKDQEIVYSRSVKAGKRIYYLDVKRNRINELFLCITESKKVVKSDGDQQQVQFEKHKIFLYKEDFKKFADGLAEVISFIEHENESQKEAANSNVSHESNEDSENHYFKLNFDEIEI
ncbi:MAG: DUF3276 family protein [Bacteroidales bacterium]